MMDTTCACWCWASGCGACAAATRSTGAPMSAAARRPNRWSSNRPMAEAARLAAEAIGAPLAGVDLLPGRDGTAVRDRSQRRARLAGPVANAQGRRRSARARLLRPRAFEQLANRQADSSKLAIMSNLATPRDTRAIDQSGVNVARRLTATAARMPEALAVVVPPRPRSPAARQLRHLHVRPARSRDAIAWPAGCGPWASARARGWPCWCGRASEFISLVFALFKAGAVDRADRPGHGPPKSDSLPGRGRARGLHRHADRAGRARACSTRRFRRARFNVTVGRRLVLGRLDARRAAPPRRRRSRSATTRRGRRSGGDHLHHRQHRPAQGRALSHGNFDRQVTEIGEFYGIQPGEVDLPGFPLFGLFNCAMGVTTVIPDMDPDASGPGRSAQNRRGGPRLARDAGVWLAGDLEPRRPILPEAQRAAADAASRAVGRGAGAAARAGADESRASPPRATCTRPTAPPRRLPVASIAASEVLSETRQRWASGRRHVRRPQVSGHRVEGDSHRRRPDRRSLADAVELPRGEIGELIVRGPGRDDALRHAASKPTRWPRSPTARASGTAWATWAISTSTAASGFAAAWRIACDTPAGSCLPIPCEAIFNQHPAVYRSALVGIGPPGSQRPAIVVEPWPGQMPRGQGRRGRN